VTPFLARLGAVPTPADPDRVQVGLERWFDRAEQISPATLAFARSVDADPAGRALMAALFGNSPFLTECWLADPEQTQALLTDGPEASFARIMAGINDDLARSDNTNDVMRSLRQAKRAAALAIALGDITGLWRLEQVTHALSDLAEAAIDVATGHHLLQGVRRGGQDADALSLADARRGLIVLGMGKLGARELNYSSDIDVIVLYDEDRLTAPVRAATEKRGLQDFFVRVTRGLVAMLEERTRDGYVFRTDLRLRPDPASTPPALSILAAETYYESVGQNWERAAMIKARPVGGDREAGDVFLRHLRPFIWRRHLDFAAIQDIHSIKRQINAHRGGGTVAVRGHNLKLGRGGIREIEFFAQTQQLIWGGRDPSLRISPTCQALDALVTAGRVRPEVRSSLQDNYRILRTLEHRLQMLEDQQTQTLPSDEAALTRMALFSGYADLASFEANLRRVLTEVEGHYARLFEESPTLSAEGNLVFTGGEDDPDTVRTLEGLGFKDGASISAIVRGWHHGRIRATRSVRSREILTELMPALVRALARVADPDVAFARFDRFLSGLPAGVQLFSLLQARPELLDFVAEIMGSAAGLADYLARHPILLDGVISNPLRPGDAGDLPGVELLIEDLDQALTQARDFQDVLDIVRRWTGDRKFQMGVAMLRGDLPIAAATQQISHASEAVLRCLLPHVQDSFAQTHGRVPGGDLAILALGKLGGRELTLSSDLDLFFTYDAPAGCEGSDGRKPLPVSLYYQRLAQRIVSALTALTAEGELFEVDLRLRPDGNKGPIAQHLTGVAQYYRDNAWTWEMMALTRARVVASTSQDFAQRVESMLLASIARPRDAVKLVTDIADMRQRIAREKPAEGEFDVKTRRGGLVDIEFITQYLILRHAAERPGIVTGTTADALQKLEAEACLRPDQAHRLQRALGLWQAIQAVLRIAITGAFDPDTAPAGTRNALVRISGAVDFTGLRADMAHAAADVSALFEDLIDRPATLALAQAGSPAND